MVMESVPLGAVPGPMKTTLIVDDGRGLRQGIPRSTPIWERTCLLYLGGFKEYNGFNEEEFYEEEYDNEYEEYDEWDEFSEFLDNQK